MHPKKGLLFLFLAVSFYGINFTLGCLAEPTQQGLTLFGLSPKYPLNFTHVDYVSPKAQKGGAVRLAIPGTFDSLNPFIITGIPAPSLDLIHATLLKSADDPIITAYPYAAESYELDPTEDSITFNLRPNLRFSDGSPVTAEDVRYSFELLSKKGAPFFRSIFKDITAVTLHNTLSLTFHFSPTASQELPLLIGRYLYILSKDFYSNHDFEKPSLDLPVTSGPYAYKSADPGRSVTLERIKNWWGETVPVTRFMYNFDNIHFIYFRDPSIAFEAFKKGDVDFRHEMISKFWATEYNFPAVVEGKVKRRVIPHQAPTGMLGFVFNTRRPPFNNPRVREAISFLLDFDWINKNLLHSHYTRLKSFFTHTPFAATGLPSPKELALLEPFRQQLPERLFTQAYTPDPFEGQKASRSRAKHALRLLTEAGFKVINGKLISPLTHKPLQVEIISNSPAMKRITIPFINGLRSIGIEASYRDIDPSQYIERTNGFDFDIIAGGVVSASSHPGAEQENYFGSTSCHLNGSQNLAGISNPVVDSLLKKVLQAQTLDELIPAARALDRVLLWNFYFIPKWGTHEFYIAYWDKLNYPDTTPFNSVGFETWWIKTPPQAP